MLWFEGSIPDAINSAKQRNCIFVVVITGQDEQSAQLMSSWEDDRVSEETRDCCVAIKVDAKSDSCVQFSQIYPVVCVPSSFFIGENGIPLEVIAGSVSAEELIRRISRVKQMHVQHITGGLMTEVSAPVETTLHGSTEPGPASAPALPISSAATEPAIVPGSLSSTGGHKSAVENPSSDHLTQDEENLLTKDERLTKKMESQEKKKTEAEKEIKRRKLGKDFQDFKRKQEEEKTKRLLEERNREQVEEKAARERVKQQIALDRAERAARYAKTQEEEKAARQALLQAGHAEQEARKKAAVRERSNKTRIQFRLPDGSSFTNQFPSQSRLQEARQFALQEVGNQYGNFSMATMFPRRVFTGEDLNKTLLELELTPSASIVLLPQLSRPGNAVTRSSDGGIWAVLGTLLYPLLAVWRFLSSFLFATRPVSRIPTHQTTLHASLDSDKAKRETRSTHSVDKQPKDFKKDGNICRLRTQEDSEEDNTTWNGNSTQQM